MHAVLYELLILLLAGVVLVHAAFLLFRSIKSKSKPSITFWILHVVWFVLAAYTLTLWPGSAYPFFSARRSLFFFGILTAFLTAIFATAPATERWIGTIRKWGKIIHSIACVLLVFSIFRHAVMFRPTIAGPDFFYYLCTARHMASGLGDLSMDRYFYFPGVFQFWRAALTLGDGTLDSLQWWYLVILSLNSLLVGAIIWRVIRNASAACIGTAWCLLFYSRMDGFRGVTEPIATLPVLVGILVWGGKSLTDRSGLMRVLALGTGLGIGLYMRQQAGLLSLGAISLLITYFTRVKANPVVNFSRLLLLALISAAVLLIGVLFEGFGFQPLVIAFQRMPGYGFESDFWTALRTIVERIPVLAAGSILAILIYTGCLFHQRFRILLFQPWCQIVGFTSFAGFFSLVSLISRSHAHYGLFAGPMWIISSAIVIVWLIRIVPYACKSHPVFIFAVLMLALWPFARVNFGSTFYAWPVDVRSKLLLNPGWHQTSGPAEDLKTLKQYLKPMEKIYVLPPSQNVIHFFLGTRYPTYAWGLSAPLATVLQSSDLQGVIVLRRDAVTHYNAILADRMSDYNRAESILTEFSFEPVLELSTMTLWRKSF